MGRRKVPDLVLTCATRTSPSWLFGWISNTLQNGHEHLGVESPTTRTRSPASPFRENSDHFIYFCNEGKYFQVHRFQNISERYWTCLQRFWLNWSLFANIPGGQCSPARKRRNWFGDKACKSFGLSETFVSGLLLRMDSTSHIKVDSHSSLRLWFFRRGSYVPRSHQCEMPPAD